MSQHSGSISTDEFQDLARNLLGNDAYLLFHLDRLVANIIKQLIHFQNDQASLSAK